MGGGILFCNSLAATSQTLEIFPHACTLRLCCSVLFGQITIMGQPFPGGLFRSPPKLPACATQPKMSPADVIIFTAGGSHFLLSYLLDSIALK